MMCTSKPSVLQQSSHAARPAAVAAAAAATTVQQHAISKLADLTAGLQDVMLFVLVTEALQLLDKRVIVHVADDSHEELFKLTLWQGFGLQAHEILRPGDLVLWSGIKTEIWPSVNGVLTGSSMDSASFRVVWRGGDYMLPDSTLAYSLQQQTTLSCSTERARELERWALSNRYAHLCKAASTARWPERCPAARLCHVRTMSDRGEPLMHIRARCVEAVEEEPSRHHKDRTKLIYAAHAELQDGPALADSATVKLIGAVVPPAMLVLKAAAADAVYELTYMALVRSTEGDAVTLVSTPRTSAKLLKVHDASAAAVTARFNSSSNEQQAQQQQQQQQAVRQFSSVSELLQSHCIGQVRVTSAVVAGIMLPALHGQRLSVEHVHMLVNGSNYLPWHVLLRDDDAMLHAATAAGTSNTAGTVATSTAATAAATTADAADHMAVHEYSQRSEHWPASTASSTPGNNNNSSSSSSSTITAVVDSTALTTRLWCNVPPQCVPALPTVVTDMLRAWSSGRDRATVLLHCYEHSEIDENGVSLSGGLQFRVLDMQLLPPHTDL
jgi:hypothetical protein